MLRTHVLDGRTFTVVATGYGDAGAVGVLRAGQYSKRLLLLRGVIDTAAEVVPAASRAAQLDDSIALLATAQDADPLAVRKTLLEPQVGAWAAHCLRRLSEPVDDRHQPGADLTQLGAVAVTAAARAGVPFDVELPLRAGGVALPGWGVLRLPGSPARARFRYDAQLLRIGRVEIPFDVGAPVPGAVDRSDGWSAIRRMTSTADGLTLDVALDDLDPYRDPHHLGATRRLTPTAVAGWRELLDEAWSLLVTRHRRYAEGIAAGLTCLVPLAGDGTARGMSATSRETFGAVALTRPANAAAFAVALVHEFQHNKLGALLDLVPLYDVADRRYHYAPWRDDPRPLGGLLQGAYAFLGVADFWRVQRLTDAGPWATTGGPDPGPTGGFLAPVTAGGSHPGLAHFEYARWRERVARVLDVLRGSGSFLPPGRRLLDAMRGTVESWRDDPVPATVVELAREVSEDHRLRWRLSNLRPDPAEVTRLAEAYGAGRPVPVDTLPESTTTPRARALEPEVRLDIAMLRMSKPDRFAELRALPGGLAGEFPGASAADAALISGDYTVAAAGYRRVIAEDPDCPQHWAGLALAVRHLPAQRAAAGPLSTAPELVYAVHRAVRQAGGPAPDPVQLSAWLAGPARTVPPR